MRIVCPSCQAAYEVPESLLVGGKSVRCAKCATTWAPLPPPAPPLAPAEAAPDDWPPPLPELGPVPQLRPEPRLGGYRGRNIDTADDARPPPRDDETEPPPPPRRGVLAAWLLSLLVLVALIWAAVAFRAGIVAAWPPSARLYDMLGLR